VEDGKMKTLEFKKIIVIIALGLLGWALCGAIMFIGMTITDLQTTMIVHAVGAPIIFSSISWFYFNRFHYTSPVQTAVIFLFIVMFMDFFLVALVINKSLEMFQSLLGTWVPFVLIFSSTYLTGLVVYPREVVEETV
jgi:hypothetical protein